VCLGTVLAIEYQPSYTKVLILLQAHQIVPSLLSTMPSRSLTRATQNTQETTATQKTQKTSATLNTQKTPATPRNSFPVRYDDEKYFSSDEREAESIDSEASDDDGYSAVPYDAEKKCFLTHASVDEKYYSDSEDSHEKYYSNSNDSDETYSSDSEHDHQDENVKSKRQQETRLHYYANTYRPLEPSAAVHTYEDEKYDSRSAAGKMLKGNVQIGESQRVRKTVGFDKTQMHRLENAYRTLNEFDILADEYVPGRWATRSVWTWVYEWIFGRT